MQRHPSPGAPKSRFRRRSRTGRTSCGCSLEFALQHLNRSRYYDTGQGRFLQQDSYRGDSLTPPSLHRYAYVHNNPVRYSDPTGQFINGFMGTVGVLALAGLLLGMKPDKAGHFLSGYAATMLLLLGTLAILPNLNTMAGVAMFVVISIIVGTMLEEFQFNTGGFDVWDWVLQTLGSLAAGLLMLLMLAEVSPVAAMGSEMLAPVAYWSAFYLVVGAGLAGFGLLSQGLGGLTP